MATVQVKDSLDQANKPHIFILASSSTSQTSWYVVVMTRDDDGVEHGRAATEGYEMYATHDA